MNADFASCWWMTRKRSSTPRPTCCGERVSLRLCARGRLDDRFARGECLFAGHLRYSTCREIPAWSLFRIWRGVRRDVDHSGHRLSVRGFGHPIGRITSRCLLDQALRLSRPADSGSRGMPIRRRPPAGPQRVVPPATTNGDFCRVAASMRNSRASDRYNPYRLLWGLPVGTLPTGCPACTAWTSKPRTVRRRSHAALAGGNPERPASGPLRNGGDFGAFQDGLPLQGAWRAAKAAGSYSKELMGTIYALVCVDTGRTIVDNSAKQNRAQQALSRDRLGVRDEKARKLKAHSNGLFLGAVRVCLFYWFGPIRRGVASHDLHSADRTGNGEARNNRNLGFETGIRVRANGHTILPKYA